MLDNICRFICLHFRAFVSSHFPAFGRVYMLYFLLLDRKACTIHLLRYLVERSSRALYKYGFVVVVVQSLTCSVPRKSQLGAVSFSYFLDSVKVLLTERQQCRKCSTKHCSWFLVSSTLSTSCILFIDIILLEGAFLLPSLYSSQFNNGRS